MLLRKVVRASLTAAAGAGLVAGGLALSTAVVEPAASSTPTVVMTPAAPASGFVDQTPITVSVGANSLFTPGALVNVLECADPGGLQANLPIDASTCDGTTIQPNSIFIKSDGSFAITNYPIFELPNATLGENASFQPSCDLSNFCVLYVGQNQNDFTQPKVFSQPFLVGTPSSTTVTTSATPVAFSGGSATITATVAAQNGGGAFVPPTGTVSFSADGAPIAACQNVALSATQTAACTVQGSALGGGVHSIGARYSGDGRVAGSSGSVAQEVTGGPTNMVAQEAILQLSPLSVNLLTLKATLTSATTHAGVTGQTVVFTAGGSTLCTATTNSAGLASCSILTNVSADVATITADGYKATFAGSADWLASSGSSGLIG